MKNNVLIFSTVLASVLHFGEASAWFFQSKPVEVEAQKEQTIFRLNIEKEYLDYIIEGKKISEGRINLPEFSAVKQGDFIHFWDDEGRTAICKVTSVGRYDNFSKMLVSNGVVSMLPSINPDNYTSDQLVNLGVQIYDGFPGYKELVKIYGSIAFGLQYIGPEE